MIKTETKIYGLKEYNLDLKKLVDLGDRIVEVFVALEHWCEKDYFKYPPAIRRKKKGEWNRNAYKKIVEKWPSNSIQKSGSHFKPLGFTSQLKAKNFPKAIKIALMDHISILNIHDLPKIQNAVEDKNSYFSVKARFVRQIEGMKKGLQQYEERIVLVKAFSFEDAEKRAMMEFKDYEHTFLAAHGMEMIRWKFEEIIETYDVCEEEIDPKGTEVFSEFKYRRMKPEYEWHPEYEDES